MVVDDDEAVRKAYQDHFSAVGFEVESARSLREAAERLARHTFQAVIADVCLSGPAAEGFAVAAFLRQLPGARPVVVLTAYGMPSHGEAAARLGADLFLHKPVSLHWLEGLLRTLIEERRSAAAAS